MKNKLSNILFITYLIVIIVLLKVSFINKLVSDKNTNEYIEEMEGPGWYEQYFRMKKNEDGIVPSTALVEAYNQTMIEKRNSKTSTGGVSNIKSIKELGPSNVGGRTRALLIDKSNTSHLIAGGISGGIWNSYDNGNSWQQVNDFGPTLSVSCITQDYFNPQNIYYGTGEGSGNSADISGSGIFKSTDGGQTFQQLPATNGASFNTIWSIKTDPTKPDKIYVATQSYGLKKSIDAGNSFRSIKNSGEIQDVEVLPDGKVFYTQKGTGIFKSYTGDSGTFFKVSSGLPISGYQRIEIAYAPSDPAIMYAVFGGIGSYYTPIEGIYKSLDTGKTWGSTTSNFDLNGGSDFPWYCLTVGVKPDNPKVVYVGSIIVRYSTNGGLTWKNVNGPPPGLHSDNHTMAFNSQSDEVFIGNDGGIFYINSALLPVAVNKNNGYNVTQFYAGAFFPGSGDDFFAGAQDNGTQSGKNGNTNTIHIAGGDGSFTQINRQNPNISFVSSQNGYILKSINSLNATPTFTKVLTGLDANSDGSVDDPTWFINPYEINPVDGNQLYFVTQQRVFRTTNGAGLWIPLTQNIGYCYSIGISKQANPTVYIGGDNGLFYRVDNASTSTPGQEINLFSSVPSSINSGFIACLTVNPNNSGIVYASFSNFSIQPRVWKITNAKTTPVWTNISGNLPINLPANWIEVDPQHSDSVYFIGTDIGLFSTRDAGTNWTYEDAVIPHVPIMNIRMRQDGRLFIFTHGRGAYRADMLYGPNDIDEKAISQSDVKIYPNPAQDYIFIQSDNEPQKAIIFDVTGKQILSADFDSYSEKSGMDISSLKKGIYFLRVKYKGAKEVTRKVIRL